MNIIPKGSRHCSNTYIVNVTPEMAKAWLDSNNFNRPRRPDLVAKYVKQINQGRWRLTHQGIAFTRFGTLLDGQHRLFAIIECGVILPFRVFINEPPENFAVIDCGKNRTALDVTRMGNKDSTLTTAHMNTLKAMLAGAGCKTANVWSNIELDELYYEHSDAVNFTVERFRECKDKQINDSTVRGVIARASYHIPTDTLDTFCSVLLRGDSHPSKHVVDAFVQCLREWKDRRENTKREIYRRCELTLEAFLNNETSISFGKTTNELFPLPKSV